MKIPQVKDPAKRAISPQARLPSMGGALRTCLVAALVLAALPAAAAKGIPEDAATYPPGVTGVTRMSVMAGGELDVFVNTDRSFDAATMFVCGFASAADAEPRVCWSPVAAKPAEGVSAFSANSAGGPHPAWKAGEVIGYKFLLSADGNETRVPADGSYYKVVVEGPAGLETRGAGGVCLLCLVGLGVAVVVRRRWKTV